MDRQTRPDQTRPDQTRPDQTRPDQTRPDQTRPDQTRPDQTRPDQTRPDQTRPDQTRPDQTRPDQTRPDQTRPDQTRPDQTRPDQTRPDQTRPDQTRPDQTRPDQTRPDQTRPDQTRPDQTRPDQTRPDQTRPDQTRPDQTRPDQTRPDQTRPDQTRPDQTRPDQTRPDQTRPDQTRPDQTRPDRQIDIHIHISFNHGDTIGIAIYNDVYSYDYFDCSTMITIALSFICVAEICQISIDSIDLCWFTHGIFQPQSQGSSVKVGLGDGIGTSYGKMMWTGGEAALGHINALVCSTWNGPRVASCHFDINFLGRASEVQRYLAALKVLAHFAQRCLAWKPNPAAAEWPRLQTAQTMGSAVSLEALHRGQRLVNPWESHPSAPMQAVDGESSALAPERLAWLALPPRYLQV